MTNIETLRQLILTGKVPAGTLDFAKNLVSSFDKYGSLTAKQEPWVGKIIDRCNNPGPAKTSLASSVIGIFNLFDKARAAGLKRPKIRLSTDKGQYLVLARCGENSKYEGQVQITDGGPFGDNRYFGRIDAAGTLSAGRDLNDDVSDMINKLAADPAHVATIYGRRTGSCCFCGKHLDDARSIEVGYGPVCAQKYGIEWGTKKADTNVTVSLLEAA